MMILLLAYVVLFAFAVTCGRGGQVLTAGVMLGNWVINTVYVIATGDAFAWPWFITVDYITALTLVLGRENRWQSTLIATYAAELVIHCGYGLSTAGQWSDYHYWWTLYYMAWLQVVLVGSWFCYDTAVRWLGAKRRVPSALDSEQAP